MQVWPLEPREPAAAEVALEESDASWAPYRHAVLRGGLRYSEMVIAWCEATEKDLRKVMR